MVRIIIVQRLRTSYQATVLKDQPTRYYRFGEQSGTTAIDEMGDANGAYVNSPALNEQALVRWGGPAARFSSVSSQYVDAAVLTAPTLPITVEVWFKPHALSGNQGIFNSNRDSSNYRGINLYASGGDDLGLNLGDGSGSSSSDRRTYIVANVLTLDEIYHYVAVINSHTSVEMWLNGTQLSPSASGSAGSVALTGGSLAVGASSQGNGFASATIDEVAIYNNKALSADRIAAHYKSGKL